MSIALLNSSPNDEGLFFYPQMRSGTDSFPKGHDMKSLMIALEGNRNSFIIHPLTKAFRKESIAVCREWNGFLIEK